MGAGPIFLVGDQPSTSEWGANNSNRCLFYDFLERLGIENAHITDLYKRRGRANQLKTAIPEEFELHLKFYRMELDLFKPKQIIAVGNLSYVLLKKHVPETRMYLGKIWHFSYVSRFKKKKILEYDANYFNALETYFS